MCCFISALLIVIHAESLREDTTAQAKDDGQKESEGEEEGSGSNTSSDAYQNSGRKRSDSKDKSTGDLAHAYYKRVQL
jgi:hypothetical protein